MGSAIVGKRHPIQKRANSLSLKTIAKKLFKFNLSALSREGGADGKPVNRPELGLFCIFCIFLPKSPWL